MGTFVLKDAYISVNGQVLSSKSNQVSLPLEVETHDETTFGQDTRKNKAGLKNWSMDISFFQDFADNDLDEQLWGIWDAGTPVTFAIRPTSGDKSATNPEYTATGIIQSYTPMGGGVGEMAGTQIHVIPAGDDNTMERLTA